jgi:hypothetical protein
MALFNPEVRTVNGSNVGTYSPPTVDYSNFFAGVGASIASIVETKNRGGSVSEGDKKALALRDVTSNIQRAFEIEDPTVRATTLKIMQQKSLLEYPMYRDDVKGIFAEFTGEVYTATGMSPEDLQQANAYKWATDTSEGQSAVALATLKSKGDQILADQLIKESYYKDLIYKNRVSAIDQETKLLESDEKKRKLLFETNIRPSLQAKVDDNFSQDTSPEFINVLTQKAIVDKADVTTYLLSSLKATREQRLAEVTNEINRMRLDPTTINPETFMKGYDAAILTLEQNKDLLKRGIESKTDEEKAKVVTNLTDPFVRDAALKGNPIFLTELINLNPKNKAEIANLSNASIGSAGNGMNPTVASSTLSTGTTGDSAVAFSQNYSGVAPAEELQKIFKASPEQKRSLLKMGFDAIYNYKYDANLPENTEAAARNLAGMYVVSLPDIDVEGQGIKSVNVKNLLANRAFDTINNISSTNPQLGNTLFNAMNTYTINAAKRLTDNFRLNMESIKDTDVVPFILEMDKNGNIGLNVNPEALKTDVTLKKAMGSYRYETVRKGRGSTQVGVDVAPTETDPMKILSNYTSIVNATLSRPFGEYDNRREILDNIEALKVIAMQSKNIPIEIRNRGYDPIEIIKQNVMVLGE